MQNCPQLVVSHFAVLRLDAVVVPVNPMNKAEELKHYITDPDTQVAITTADLAGDWSWCSVQAAAWGDSKSSIPCPHLRGCLHRVPMCDPTDAGGHHESCEAATGLQYAADSAAGCAASAARTAPVQHVVSCPCSLHACHPP
jgi:hypothetical protein